jgi:hypothetical protein
MGCRIYAIAALILTILRLSDLENEETLLGNLTLWIATECVFGLTSLMTLIALISIGDRINEKRHVLRLLAQLIAFFFFGAPSLLFSVFSKAVPRASFARAKITGHGRTPSFGWRRPFYIPFS